MTWTRERTADGLPIIERHSSGGHITEIAMGGGRWSFDAWGAGLGGFRLNLGNYATAQEAQAAVERHANA